MYDLIILGGGPAGLTATIYALRKRLNALLITHDLGGKTNYRLQLPFVNQYLVISGEEIVKRFISEINYLEFARVFDKAEKIKKIKQGYEVSTREGNKYQTKALIIATGALGRLLDVPGEKEYMMRGLCYSAVSYAPLFIERNAVVIGDTHLALRSTAELARIAKKVSLVAPTHGALDSPMGRKVLSAPNVEILDGFQVNAFHAEPGSKCMPEVVETKPHLLLLPISNLELGKSYLFYDFPETIRDVNILPTLRTCHTASTGALS